MSDRLWIRISRRREIEFGIAFGTAKDWVDKRIVVSVRLSFGRYALIIIFRGKQK